MSTEATRVRNRNPSVRPWDGSRTFAYVSGPAYGLLLDEGSPGWHRALRASDDLGILLMSALAVQPASDAAGAYHAWGDWGRLEAENGVLLASDGRTRRVPTPVRRDDGTFTGDWWTFSAAPGWIVREGARRGDYEVVRRQ